MKNMKRYFVIGLASLALVAMMGGGCGTIDQGLIDQAQVAIDHWLDKKTNAPPASVDVPLPPVVMPTWDVKHFAAAGNVNWHGQSNVDNELDKLIATGIPAYMVEAFGWGPSHGYDDVDAVIARLGLELAGCKARGLRFVVLVCNGNQGILKYGNTDKRTLKDFRPQITKVLRWLQANDCDILYIQPVGETQDKAGEEIEAEAAKMFPRERLFFNGDGGAPRRIPSWAINAVYHKTHLTDSVPRGYVDSSDHGVQLAEFGGTMAQDYDDAKVQANSERARANGGPCWLYMFQQHEMSVSDLAALHRGYYGAAVAPTVPPPSPGTTNGDAVDFGALQWQYGGFNGARAVLDVPRISGLTMNGKSGLTFRWDTGLASWGLGNDEAGALACLFTLCSDGVWRGGKFDWISTSRSTRDFENLGGYNGWSWGAIPNPCKAAFVVVSADGKRRSNVITADWRR